MPSPENAASAFDPFAGPAIALAFPSTAPQREIWAASQLSCDATLAYNEAVVIDLRGELDVSALRSAVALLCARHESLRGTFSADGLTMLVGEPGRIPIPVEDLMPLGGVAQAARREALLAEAVRTPFDLEHGPLVRFTLFRHTPEHHGLLIAAHHIVCDGWSFGVIATDLAMLYEAQRRDGATLAPAISFSRYAAETAAVARTAVRAEDERFWLAQFAGPAPVLDLPLDHPRPARRTFEAGREDLRLPAELVEAVRAAGARTGCSLFVTMLATFATLLHRLTGDEDLVVGIPSAGQASGGHDSLVGHCVNTLALRIRPHGDLPFRELLAQVRTTTLDALDHQGLGLGGLLARLPILRDPSRSPLVSVMFNLERALLPSSLAFSGLAASIATVPRAFEHFELFVNALETDEGIRLECQYNATLFDAVTVRRWLENFVVLLQAITDATDVPAGALPILTDADRNALARCNATALDVPAGAVVHDLIAAAMARTPHAIAVEHDGVALTYAELDTRANQLARHLRAMGAQRGARVGICLDRTPELLVGLLAILRTGACYVPLDPTYPADHLVFMASDAALTVLLSESRHVAEVTLPARAVVRLDADAAAIAAWPPLPLEPSAASAMPDDIAYVIYTSGSTGRPKGVLVPHRAVVNLLCSVQREPGLSADDVVLAITTLSFDIAVSELLLPLTVGARIVLASRETASDGVALSRLIADAGVTFIDATPATYRLLLAAGWCGGTSVRLICTGEAMPRDLARTLVGCVREVWNGYGPTETTVWSTFARITAPVGRILIGRPVANTRVRVVDTRGQQVPVGVAGELIVGGRGVTSGYLHRDDLTAERFIDDPAEPGARWYRTGDLVRLLPCGDLECLGRNDAQVKVRGYRIEPGEIEAVLTRWPGVISAAVIASEDPTHEVRLVAYVALQGGGDVPEALRVFLRQSLPAYMVPSRFVGLAVLPLTPSGKVDRKALPRGAERGVADATAIFVGPRTAAELTVAALWCEALGLSRISIHDDFFALGGHSLLASQVLSRLRRDHDVRLSFRQIFDAPTVHAFAALVAGASVVADRAARTAAPRAMPALTDRAPLTVLQERLWMLEEMQPAQGLAHAHTAAWRLRGAIDVDRLENAIRCVIDRHTVLRSSFRVDEGVRWQVVAPRVPFVLARHDMSSLAPTAQELALHEFFRTQQHTPFDLAQAPLFRAALIQVRPDEHMLCTMQHGIVWDGWSVDLFLQDVATYYADSATPLEPVPVAYQQFAAWQAVWLAGDEAARQQAFWQRQLGGELQELVLLTDRPRPRDATLAGSQVTLTIPAAVSDQLRTLAHQNGSTLFMVLLAAWNVLLHRYSGLEDLLVGSPVRARTDPELEQVIGPFVNTVLLRTMITADLGFRELLASVRDTALDAFGHQELPFDRIGVRVPPVRVLFSMQDTRTRPIAMGDLVVTQHHVPQFVSTNDLLLWMMESHDGLTAVLNFSTELFDQATAHLMLSQLHALLLGVVACPEGTVGSFDLGSHEAVPVMACDRAELTAPVASVADRVAHWSEVTPDHAAIRDGSVTVTYAALDVQARRVAVAVAARGHGAGTTVAIALPHRASRVVATLGVLRAGAAVTFIDPMDPAPFRSAQLRACGATLCIMDQSDSLDVASLILADIPVDDAFGASAAVDSTSPAFVVTAPVGNDGVATQVVSGLVLATTLHALAAQLSIDATDVVLTAGHGSEPWALVDLLLPLVSGATLTIASDDAREVPRDLAVELRDGGVTLCLAAEDRWRGLLATSWAPTGDFAAVVTMGALPGPWLTPLLQRAPRVFTLLGSLADAGASSLHRVSAEDVGCYVGTPLTRASPSVHDAGGRIEAVGIPGVLRMNVDGVPVTLAARARRTSDGRVQLLQDAEDFLWLDGAPVGAAAIRDALRAHAAVHDAAVAIHRDATGARRLVAYVVTDSVVRLVDAELRATVRTLLPSRCIPQRVVRIDSVPRDRDGVVDVGRLPSPFAVDVNSRHVAAPRTSAEVQLADAWRSVLGIDAVSVTDNFFQLGGTSLLCFRVVDEVRRTSGQSLSPRALLLGTLEQAAAGMTAAADLNLERIAAPDGGVMSRLKVMFSGTAG